jgi:glycosyltransferase involved in cell wall biosynthesis
VHVAQISFFVDPQGRAPAQLLNEWPSLVDIAEAVSRQDVRVSVIQASTRAASLERNGVNYRFVQPDSAAKRIAHGKPFRTAIDSLAVDVLHVHGLSFPSEIVALAEVAPNVPILLQDHANRPPPIWRRREWRRGFSVASGIAFCARAQSQSFIDTGLVSADTAIYEIPESTSRFTPGDRAAARRLTQIEGDPAVLWVGHLDANKDPLTVLDGMSKAARQLPGLQLWCCFGTAPLLSKVRARIEGDPLLSGRVHLLGRVPHEKIEQLMRAADVFVSGSHREGSGYSLLEALACGLTPVVTDIPSFRVLTGGGAVGQLWSCGDAQQLGDALVATVSQLSARSREQVRAHFDAELSFDALGRKLAAAYRRCRD